MILSLLISQLPVHCGRRHKIQPLYSDNESSSSDLSDLNDIVPMFENEQNIEDIKPWIHSVEIKDGKRTVYEVNPLTSEKTQVNPTPKTLSYDEDDHQIYENEYRLMI